MHKNKALIDRALDISSNNTTVTAYRKLVSLIEEYNRIANDKGLPTKKIPVYSNAVSCVSMARLTANIFNDIDRIKNMKNNTGDRTLLTGVTFENNTFKDGIWIYIVGEDNKVSVKLSLKELVDIFPGDTVTLGYDYMPYERLIDTEGNEYITHSYNKLFVHEANVDISVTVTSLIINDWTNSNIDDMEGMFYDGSMLASITLNNFNTSGVENMAWMFDNCRAITSLNLSSFNTSGVENMSGMFRNCSSLTSLTLGDNFNTYSVTDMSSMFARCSVLTSIPINNFNTINVTDMNNMFYMCSSLTSLTLGDNFNTSGVENMAWMFGECSELASLNLSNFNTAKVTNMRGMFFNCSKLTLLDLSNFDTSIVNGVFNMFGFCSALISLKLGENFRVPSVYNVGNMTNLAPSATCKITMNENAYTAFKTYDLAPYTFSPNAWNAEGGDVQEITVEPPSSSS